MADRQLLDQSLGQTGLLLLNLDAQDQHSLGVQFRVGLQFLVVNGDLG